MNTKPIENNNNSKLGKLGEQIAMQYLIQNGYTVLKTNWRFKQKEIDIIAQNDRYIIFVEVKTRFGTATQHPLEAVTKSKQKFLISAANEYIRVNNIPKDVRFDIIGIVKSYNTHTIEHIQDAFLPGL